MKLKITVNLLLELPNTSKVNEVIDEIVREALEYSGVKDVEYRKIYPMDQTSMYVNLKSNNGTSVDLVSTHIISLLKI